VDLVMNTPRGSMKMQAEGRCIADACELKGRRQRTERQVYSCRRRDRLAPLLALIDTAIEPVESQPWTCQ
jgi:hypothetical protein